MACRFAHVDPRHATPAHAAAAGAYAVLNWLLDVVCLGACVLAFGGRVGVTELLLAFCAGMAAVTISLIPAGLGVIDNALVLGLLAGGTDTTTAITAAVPYRIISFGFTIGVGWIFWLVISRNTTEFSLTESDHHDNGGNRNAEPADRRMPAGSVAADRVRPVHARTVRTHPTSLVPTEEPGRLPEVL